MMTFAGYDLVIPTDNLLPLVERWWDEYAPDLWSHQGYALEKLHHLPIPDRPKQFKTRLNTLYWPTGASRWGVFHGLIDGATATKIQILTGGAGTSQVPKNLILKDEIQDQAGNATVTASMYLLALRPIFVLGNYNLHWITLVDKRFLYWRQHPTYIFNSGTSWTDLLTNLSLAAGAPTPTISSIPGSYGSPDYFRWKGINRPIPLLMDAAAQQIGLRYTLSLDGSSAAFVNYSTASTTDTNNYNNNISHVAIGGRNSVRNIIGNIPDTVAVSFWGDTPTIIDVTLASLALTEYSGLNGVSPSYGYVGVDQPASETSPTQSSVASQAATDYYRWALSLNDVTFRSIRQLQTSGLEDRIEWEYVSIGPSRIELDDDQETEPRILSRIVPRDFHDQNVYGDKNPFIVNSGGFFARLLNTNGVSWNIQSLKVSARTDIDEYVDDTLPTTNYPAYPLTVDGVSLCNPVTGLRVWVIPSKQTNKYEFIPYGYADGPPALYNSDLTGTSPNPNGQYWPGLVSLAAQTWKGNKTLVGDFIEWGRTSPLPTAHDRYCKISSGSVYAQSYGVFGSGFGHRTWGYYGFDATGFEGYTLNSGGPGIVADLFVAQADTVTLPNSYIAVVLDPGTQSTYPKTTYYYAPNTLLAPATMASVGLSFDTEDTYNQVDTGTLYSNTFFAVPEVKATRPVLANVRFGVVPSIEYFTNSIIRNAGTAWGGYFYKHFTTYGVDTSRVQYHWVIIAGGLVIYWYTVEAWIGTSPIPPSPPPPPPDKGVPPPPRPGAPVVNFIGSPTSGPAPLIVAFTTTQTSSPTVRLLDFGDGTAARTTNPSHTYTTPGTYTVKYQAGNASGVGTYVETNYITVSPTLPSSSPSSGAPVASFTATPLAGDAPLTVTFTDTSTNTPTSWSWTIGPNKSTAQNPVVVIRNPGTFDVTLAATNASGTGTFTESALITVFPTTPSSLVASFDYTPATGTHPFDVTFTDTTTGGTPSYTFSWDFGDTYGSTTESPVHTYTIVGPVVCIVTLTVTDANGNTSNVSHNVAVS